MKTPVRKLLLTTHLVASLGWFGGAAGILALAIAALASTTGAGAMYQATEVLWRSVIMPFSLAALVTGVVQALGTQWGLFRHYWVLTKFVITSGAVLLFLLHTNSLLPALACAAMDGSAIVVEGHVHGHGGIPPRVHLVVAAGGTLLLLLVTTMLSVYKPWGRTKFAGRDAQS
jgi:hypothetical protein